ncbi:MAG: translation elongation factor Ts [Candidatus Pelagibacter sp.]|nr:translation elongation factor Ts [Candidatus Pelagibacter sp.]OUW23487.1 MAG: translation elongation factor Ts [Rickettsiales bacterium TMED174]|tara:strand:- start:168 stop:1013 length:846 start_codon:yes stop_codon:yes gene_type:complete
MSQIDEVKKLRKLCGAGFNDCLSALKEANGNIEEALEILRVKGISKASKKMSRDASEGVIAISGDNDQTSIIEVNCETDFVAKNEDFIKFTKELSEANNILESDLDKLKSYKMSNNKSVEDNIVALISKIGEKITIGRLKTLKSSGSKNYSYHHTVVKDNLSKLGVIVNLKFKKETNEINLFGKQLSMHIAALDPIALDTSLIDQDLLKKEKELIEKELKNSNKPKEIIEKISLGKIKKFKEDNSLMSQNWVMDPNQTVEKVLKNIDKDLKIIDFVRFKIG